MRLISSTTYGNPAACRRKPPCSNLCISSSIFGIISENFASSKRTMRFVDFLSLEIMRRFHKGLLRAFLTLLGPACVRLLTLVTPSTFSNSSLSCDIFWRYSLSSILPVAERISWESFRKNRWVIKFSLCNWGSLLEKKKLFSTVGTSGTNLNKEKMLNKVTRMNTETGARALSGITRQV